MKLGFEGCLVRTAVSLTGLGQDDSTFDPEDPKELSQDLGYVGDVMQGIKAHDAVDGP